MPREPGDRPGTPRPRRLGPQDVRDAAFLSVSRRRGGLDPDQVYAFLREVAEEMARLQQQVAAATTEAIRVKTALYDWQVEHAATCTHPQATTRPPQQPARQPWDPSGQGSPSGPGWSAGRYPPDPHR